MKFLLRHTLGFLLQRQCFQGLLLRLQCCHSGFLFSGLKRVLSVRFLFHIWDVIRRLKKKQVKKEMAGHLRHHNDFKQKNNTVIDPKKNFIYIYINIHIYIYTDTKVILQAKEIKIILVGIPWLGLDSGAFCWRKTAATKWRKMKNFKMKVLQSGLPTSYRSPVYPCFLRPFIYIYGPQ